MSSEQGHTDPLKKRSNCIDPLDRPSVDILPARECHEDVVQAEKQSERRNTGVAEKHSNLVHRGKLMPLRTKAEIEHQDETSEAPQPDTMHMQAGSPLTRAPSSNAAHLLDSREISLAAGRVRINPPYYVRSRPRLTGPQRPQSPPTSASNPSPAPPPLRHARPPARAPAPTMRASLARAADAARPPDPDNVSLRRPLRPPPAPPRP